MPIERAFLRTDSTCRERAADIRLDDCAKPWRGGVQRERSRRGVSRSRWCLGLRARFSRGEVVTAGMGSGHSLMAIDALVMRRSRGAPA